MDSALASVVAIPTVSSFWFTGALGTGTTSGTVTASGNSLGAGESSSSLVEKAVSVSEGNSWEVEARGG
jgi:hypothetical protein